MSLTCRVLPTLQLFCPDGHIAAGLARDARDFAGVERAFLFAAQQSAGQMRVAARLANGRPAVGYLFHMAVHFSLPGD